MKIAPKVSVILTSYNHAKYIRESIESVLKQTYRDFELIIWDDASTDDSWNIISEYTDERIRTFRNETNQFMSYFREAVSDVARGEYVAIHHSDDVWEADKLEKQVAFLDSHPEFGAVFTKVGMIGENGEPFEDVSHFYYKIFDQPNRTRHEWLNRFFYQGNALCHPSVLIRRSCYQDCGPYRHGLGQANDFDMWVRLCLKYEIHVLPEKLIRFRIRSNETNASVYRPETRIRGVFELFLILDHYRDIKSAQDFIKIFPGSVEYFKSEGFDLGFALGMTALEAGTPNYVKLFGLRLLFEALNDSRRAQKIKELYRFTHTDFVGLTAKYDVFSAELIPALSAQSAEKDRENQALLSRIHAQDRQMAEITGSMAWSVITRFRRLRLKIAPSGGRLERLLKLFFQSLRVWKNDGLGSVYRKTIQKIKRKLLPDRFQNSAPAGSLLDLRAVSTADLVPSSYDVIILSTPNWSSRFLRRRQITQAFARDGHRVFHIYSTYKKDPKITVRSVKTAGLDVKLSGPFNIAADSLDGEMTANIRRMFGSLRRELDIVDAVCIVDRSFWSSVAYSLREDFGWKIISNCAEVPRSGGELSEGTPRKDAGPIQKSDLRIVVSPSRFVQNEFDASSKPAVKSIYFSSREPWDDRYKRIKQALPSLFPKVSIIIVTYNNLEYTQLCLKSVCEKTIYPNFEVIVVDNASTDATPQFLKSFAAAHENIQVIYNAVNEGFARANNLGIAAAQGEYISLLNNDTVVTRIWLSRLVAHLGDQQVGLVGSLTNGVDNEARVVMPYTDPEALDVFAAKLAGERSNILTPIKMLAMYCVVGRSDVFRQIGPLDEQFGIGMFEDDDYSLRIRQAGYRIAVAEDVFIHHFGKSGFKILGDERYLALFEENKEKFQAKWHIKWEQHVFSTLAENRRFAADLQNILDSHPHAPGVVIFPPTIGWNISLFQRPHQLARAFAERGFLVFFCTVDNFDNVKGFKQVSPGLYLSDSPWAVFDLVRRPLVFTLPYNREYLFQFRQPLVVYEVIDDLDVFHHDKTELSTSHDILLKEADVVLVTADRLMRQVEGIRPDAILCPNAAEVKHFSQTNQSIPPDLAKVTRTGSPVIGYYGALARWFDYDLVRQAAHKHPDWDFVLIGPDHDGTLNASNILSMPNIHWLGARDYSQLPQYLCHFTVATIPFLVNNITLATSPIKLFEYMAAGKPIVTSDMPECRKYPGVFVAHDAGEFMMHLEHALTLVSDSSYIQQLFQTAQENTWDVRVRQIVNALESHENRKS